MGGEFPHDGNFHASYAIFVRKDRLTDVDESPKVLAPLEQVLVRPIVSLREATNKIITPSGLRAANVDAAIAFAENLIIKEGPDPYDLTIDQIGSINLYTQNALFKILNDVLRAEDRQSALPYFSYLRLFLSALDRLPLHTEALFRGVDKDLSEQYKIGLPMYLWAFSSASTDGDQIQRFLAKRPDHPSSMITFIQRCGKDISRYSSYKAEKEILIPIGYRWRISNATKVPGNSNLTMYIVVQESDESALS